MHHSTPLAALAPIATFLVLLEVATGTVAAAYLVDVIGRVGRGFVGTTTVICALLMGLVLLLGASLPTDTPLVHGAVGSAAMPPLLQWSLWFTVALAGFALLCAVGTDAARRVSGALTLVVGAVALGKAAVAFGPPLGGAAAAAVAFVPAALVAGSALAGMLLGHWYLVAPSLSFRPLRQVINLMFATLALQLAVIAAVVATAPAGTRAQLLRAQYALPFWLLVIGAGVGFTLAVALLTRHFARIRANQPATAMLYVLIISVVMGVVPGHLLFLVTGSPV